MRAWALFVGCLCIASAIQAQGQNIPTDQTVSAQDYIEALKQQREEAQDKLANAYMIISKLQRELDKLKAANAPHPPH